MAALVMEHARVCSVERIVDALWPHDPPASARSRVQSLVSSVRRHLGAAATVLRTEPSGYLLDISGEDVDAIAFERRVADARVHLNAGRGREAVDCLATALDLWAGTGPALEGIKSAAAQAYAVRLGELRLAATEDRLEAEAELGGRPDLVGELRTLISLDPTRERPRALLMRTLHEQGRTSEALASYREAFTFLRDELGVEPGEQLREAQRDLLASSAARQPPPRSAPAGDDSPGGAPLPNQLPPDLAYFVGREDAEAVLRKTFCRGTRPRGVPEVVVIAGMAGIGKTALAVRVAHCIRDRFAAGCLYADLRGYDPTPANPVAVASWFLGALGLNPRAIPDEPAARFALLRSATADRDLLILLDNASSEAQVRPLLPASGSAAVLVTSRQPLRGLQDVRTVTLDVLSTGDSVALLTWYAGDHQHHDDPAATEQVAQLCGGLPLALRVAGVQLGMRGVDSMRDLVRLLSDERRRLQHLSVADIGLRPSLDLGYHRLSERARTLLRRFGAASVPDLPTWLPDVLLDTVAGGADQYLDQLVDTHFVEVRVCGWTKGQRIRMHDLVWLYVRERYLAEETSRQRAETARRLYSAFLHAAEIADATLPMKVYVRSSTPLPGTRSVIAELAAAENPSGFLQAEWMQLCDAVGSCIEYRFLDLAWRLCAVLVNFVELTGRVQAGRQLIAATLDALLASFDDDDPQARAALLLARGRLDLADGPLTQETHRRFSQARRLFRKAGNAWGQSCAAVALGVAARRTGKLRLALAAYRHALVPSTDPPPHLAGYAYLGIGNLVQDSGWDRGAAAALYEYAILAFRAGGDRHGAANALGCLGIAQHRLGDQHASRAILEEAAETFTEINDVMGLAVIQQALADTLVALGDIASARAYIAQAVDVLDRYGSTVGHAMALRTRGKLGIAAGQSAEAVRDLIASARMYEELNEPAGQAGSLVLLAQAYDGNDNRELAFQSARKAYDLYLEVEPSLTHRLRKWLETDNGVT